MKRERDREKEGEEDRGGGDYTRARERNGRLKRTLNGRENANEADYSQICFEFVYTEHRPRCFIFNAAAASRFRGLPSPGMMRGYNGRVSGVSSCVVCRARCINSSESFQSFRRKYFPTDKKIYLVEEEKFGKVCSIIQSIFFGCFGDSFSPSSGIFEKVQQMELYTCNRMVIEDDVRSPCSLQKKNFSLSITNVISRKGNDILFHTFDYTYDTINVHYSIKFFSPIVVHKLLA